jgi:hypothetical protein
MKLSQLVLGGFVFPCFILAQALMFLFGVLPELPNRTRNPVGEGLFGILTYAVALTIAFRFALSLYGWVELDGAVVRGRKLLSRRLVEYRVEDLAEIRRGPVLRFRSGGEIRFWGRMMAGTDGFLEAVREVHDRVLRLGVAPPDLGGAAAAAGERWAEGRASPSEAGQRSATFSRASGGQRAKGRGTFARRRRTRGRDG